MPASASISASVSAWPRLRYSSRVRKRSRFFSLYLRTPLQGLVPSATRPQAQARENIFDSTESARLAARGVSRRR